MKLGGLSKPRGRGSSYTLYYYQKNGGGSVLGSKKNNSLALFFILILMSILPVYRTTTWRTIIKQQQHNRDNIDHNLTTTYNTAPQQPSVDYKTKKQQQQQSIICKTTTTKQRVCDKLTLFLHFHKAGGTSIISYLNSNGITSKITKRELQKRTIQHYNNGLLYLQDWNMLKLSSKEDTALSNPNFWNEYYSNGIDMVNLEYNYLLPQVSQKLNNNAVVYKLTQLREPWNRYRSTYERELWMKCHNKNVTCEEDNTLKNWMVNHTGVFHNNRYTLWPGILDDNYYVRMLNGISDRVVDKDNLITRDHLEVAKKVLDTFDTVLILEDGEKVNINKIWNHFGGRNRQQLFEKKMPKESNNYLKKNERYNEIRSKSDEMRLLFNERNQLDIELYQYAVEKYSSSSINTLDVDTATQEEEGQVEQLNDDDDDKALAVLSGEVHISSAPLFFHLSPGSSGTKTLFQATCNIGFPSVHHLAYCFSQSKGIHGVEDSVVQGLRSHLEIMRLYEMGRRCCKYHEEGKIHVQHQQEGAAAILMTTKNNETSTETELCSTTLLDWKNDLFHHLTKLIQSGIVGLFDTPYPYLADQILELSKKYRASSPIVAMTNREATSWANSRFKHELLFCRAEFSYKQRGASEFDILGCIDRAFKSSSSPMYFWQVFHTEKYIDSDLLKPGMMNQMNYFQELYTPIANYAPDMFGNHSKKMSDDQFETDIRGLILDNTRAHEFKWQDRYRPNTLRCRGRSRWDMKKDIFVEVSV